MVIRGGAVAALALVAAVAYTQTLPRNQAEFEQQVGITAAQKAKLEAITKKYQPQIEAVGKKYEPQFRAIQAKAQAEVKPILDKREKEAEAVFTPAQRAKLNQIKALQKQQMQQGRPGGR